MPYLWVYRKSCWLCTDGQCWCKYAWVMYSQLNTRRLVPKIARLLQLERLQKLCSARSGAPAGRHVVPASWPQGVMPFSHYWRKLTLLTVCGVISAGRMVISLTLNAFEYFISTHVKLIFIARLTRWKSIFQLSLWWINVVQRDGVYKWSINNYAQLCFDCWRAHWQQRVVTFQSAASGLVFDSSK